MSYVRTGVWLVTEMLPVVAVTPRISVPLRECRTGGMLQKGGARGVNGHRDWICVPGAALLTLKSLQ